MTGQTDSPAWAYQQYFGPAIFQPLAALVVDIAEPAGGDQVLDVACGTGILTRTAAGHAGPGSRVVGVDVNPAMIDVARSVPVPDGCDITWMEGDGTALDLPDDTFDLVLCQQGLQFFSDRDAGVREMWRVLRPGGRAVVAVWQGVDAHPLYAALSAAEMDHLEPLGVGRDELVAPFSLGDASELHRLFTGAGFPQVELTETRVEARFDDADHFVERLEYAYAAVVPQFAADPAAFDAYLATIAEETKAVVDEYRDGDHVIVPMHANIVVATR